MNNVVDLNAKLSTKPPAPVIDLDVELLALENKLANVAENIKAYMLDPIDKYHLIEDGMPSILEICPNLAYVIANKLESTYEERLNKIFSSFLTLSFVLGSIKRYCEIYGDSFPTFPGMKLR